MCSFPWGVQLAPGQAVKLGAVCSTKETKEAEATIEEIKSLANQIAENFPPQNLREFRKLALDAKTLKPSIKNPGVFNVLYAQKAKTLSLLNKLKALKKSTKFTCLPKEIKEKINLLLSVGSIGAIVRILVPYGKKEVAVNLPHGLAPYKTTIDSARNAWTMALMVENSPKVSQVKESTAKAEAETGKEDSFLMRRLKNNFPTGNPTKEQRPFEFYVDAYGINRKTKIPGLEKLKSDLSKQFSGVVTNPHRVWITDYGLMPSKDAGSKSLTPLPGDRYIDLDQHLSIFQYIKTHEKAYNDAAKLLHQSHPDISENTFSAFLMVNTYEELFWMQNEDPWQDTGAASWYGTEQKQSLVKTYENYLNKGYSFGIRLPDGEGKPDKIYMVPIKDYGVNMWRAASFKVPVELQGIGPNAVLIGDFLEAGKCEGGKLWRRYFPNLEMNEDNAIKVAQDPKLSVRAVAMVFDVKLKELNRTIFKRKEIRMPDDVYPTIKDEKKSREYFKLTWVRYCKAFPEVAVNFPDFFPYSHNSWNVEFLDSYFKLIQTILGQPDSLPGLKMDFIPSKGKELTDYFGDSKKAENMDALMLMVTPKK